MDSQQKGVYDEGDEKPVIRPKLGASEAIGVTAPTSALPSSSLASKEGAVGSSASKSGLAASATGAGGASAIGKKIFGVIKNNKKNVAIGGGATGGIVAIIIAIFMLLIPLKIENMVQNLGSHFFSSGQQALQGETDKLLRNYIIQQVIPGYKGHCGNTIDKNCTAKANTKGGPVSKLFNTWKDNKLENKLATKYGVEFRIESGEHPGLKLKTPYNKLVDLGPDGEKWDSVFRDSTNAEIRQAVRDATANETAFKKVYTRFQVGRLLEKKYGVRRCLFFCKISDPVFDKIKDQKIAAKLFLVNRIITPRSEIIGGAVSCLIEPACDPSSPEPTSPDSPDNPSNSDGENGRASSSLEKDNVKLLDSFLSKIGFTTAADLAKVLEDINKSGGLTRVLVEKIVTKVTNEVAGKAAGKAIPIIGWINMIVEIAQFSSSAGPKIRALGYVVNSASAVAVWGEYSSLASEVHTGHVKAAELGSFSETLGPAKDIQINNTVNPLIGGTASAEQTPLYSNLMGYGSNTQTATSSSSIASSLLSPSVFAASSTSTNKPAYVCNDKKPVPDGQLVCGEENFAAGNGIANAISDWFTHGAGAAVKAIADVWSGTIGAVINGLQDILSQITGLLMHVIDSGCSIPGPAQALISPVLYAYCSTKDQISNLIQPIVEAVINYLIPQTVGMNMSGGRTFDIMAAGADVAGNDNAHSTLGGQKLTNQQTASIMNDEYNQDLSSFNHQPLMAKIFSTDSRFSLISSIAMKVPFSSFGSTIQDMITGYISDPFSKISSSFSSIIGPRKVFAAPAFQGDPFGITQYGYPEGTIPDDPQQYWDDHCSDNAAQAYQNDKENNKWNNDAVANVDDQTRQGVNTEVNPCLLIKSATGAAGAIYDTSLLTDSQQQNLGGGN